MGIGMWMCLLICWYVMQDTTARLRFCWCEWKGKAKFLQLKSSLNQGSLAGTHVGKWTAVVKIVEIFQTKRGWSTATWQQHSAPGKMQTWNAQSEKGKQSPRCCFWRVLLLLSCVTTVQFPKQFLRELEQQRNTSSQVCAAYVHYTVYHRCHSWYG